MSWCEYQIKHFCKLKSFEFGGCQPKTMLTTLSHWCCYEDGQKWGKKEKNLTNLNTWPHDCPAQLTAAVAVFRKVITNQHKFTSRFKSVLIAFSIVVITIRTILCYGFNYFFTAVQYRAPGCCCLQARWVTGCLPPTWNNILKRTDPVCCLREAALYRKLITVSSVVVFLGRINNCQ